MSTSQKRTIKTSTLEINFDQVDRRNCYIQAGKLATKAYMDTRFSATSNVMHFGRRDTMVKYNVPRRYRPSFWKGWVSGWRTAWCADVMEKNIAFEKEILLCVEFDKTPLDWAPSIPVVESDGVPSTNDT